MISTSEIRISVITRDDLLDDAVRAVHTAFGLDSTRGGGRRLRGHRPLTWLIDGEGTTEGALPTLGIVGATGAVGRVVLDVLPTRHTHWSAHPARRRSRGRRLGLPGRRARTSSSRR